jgi:hypothetical protein
MEQCLLTAPNNDDAMQPQRAPLLQPEASQTRAPLVVTPTPEVLPAGPQRASSPQAPPEDEPAPKPVPVIVPSDGRSSSSHSRPIL